MMALIQEDISGQQVVRVGQIFGFRQRLEARRDEPGTHVLGVGVNRDIRQRGDAAQHSGGLDVRGHARRAILLAVRGDRGGIVVCGLQRLPVGRPLVLVIADVVVQRRRAAQVRDLQAHVDVGIPEHHRPRAGIPCL